MDNNGQKIILIAEDDDDHFVLTNEAIEIADLNCLIHRVQDGVEMLDYLYRREKYQSLSDQALPCLILLDLNMPKMDGREVLAEINREPPLNRIPLLALTTSHSQEDVTRLYELGINSFFRKPAQFSDWVKMMRLIKAYWLETAILP